MCIYFMCFNNVNLSKPVMFASDDSDNKTKAAVFIALKMKWHCVSKFGSNGSRLNRLHAYNMEEFKMMV